MPPETVIRFVTEWRNAPYDEHTGVSGHRTGIFRTAYRLWRDRTLEEPARTELRALLNWFNENLAQPEGLAMPLRADAHETAQLWIRASARHHITQLRRMAGIVGGADIPVDELSTTRPGHILYRDAYQVIAVPFADTPR